MDQEYV